MHDPAVDSTNDVALLQPGSRGFGHHAHEAELGQVDVERLADVHLPVQQISEPLAELEDAIDRDDGEEERERRIRGSRANRQHERHFNGLSLPRVDRGCDHADLAARSPRAPARADAGPLAA
jgi:hypothetical protein